MEEHKKQLQADKIRGIVNNSVSINPNIEKVIGQYKTILDWMLWELSITSSKGTECKYSSPVGTITINIK